MNSLSSVVNVVALMIHKEKQKKLMLNEGLISDN